MAYQQLEVILCQISSYIHIFNIGFVLVWFYGISTFLYVFIKYIGFGLVWFGLVWFHGILTIIGYLMPTPLYTNILSIYDLVGMGLWHVNSCRLFNAKFTLYIFIKYI